MDLYKVALADGGFVTIDQVKTVHSMSRREIYLTKKRSKIEYFFKITTLDGVQHEATVSDGILVCDRAYKEAKLAWEEYHLLERRTQKDIEADRREILKEMLVSNPTACMGQMTDYLECSPDEVTKALMQIALLESVEEQGY